MAFELANTTEQKTLLSLPQEILNQIHRAVFEDIRLRPAFRRNRIDDWHTLILEALLLCKAQHSAIGTALWQEAIVVFREAKGLAAFVHGCTTARLVQKVEITYRNRGPPLLLLSRFLRMTTALRSLHISMGYHWNIFEGHALPDSPTGTEPMLQQYLPNLISQPPPHQGGYDGVHCDFLLVVLREVSPTNCMRVLVSTRLPGRSCVTEDAQTDSYYTFDSETWHLRVAYQDVVVYVPQPSIGDLEKGAVKRVDTYDTVFNDNTMHEAVLWDFTARCFQENVKAVASAELLEDLYDKLRNYHAWSEGSPAFRNLHFYWEVAAAVYEELDGEFHHSIICISTRAYRHYKLWKLLLNVSDETVLKRPWRMAYEFLLKTNDDDDYPLTFDDQERFFVPLFDPKQEWLTY